MRLVKAADQVHQSGLACPCFAYQSYRFARSYIQIEVMKYRMCFLVGKAHVLDADLALHSAFLPLRSVSLGTDDFRLQIDQGKYPFCRSLGMLHFGEEPRYIGKGLEEMHGIADEGHQGAVTDGLCQHRGTAEPHHDASAQGRYHQDHRHKQS
ncbi:hypothetical protein DSECCO2_528920 [anaerobic digester metagenome]